MIEGIIIPAIGGLLSSAFGGIVGNRADTAVLTAWKAVVKRLGRSDGRPINLDLQRAIIRSYISALSTICDECLAELGTKKKDHEKELIWLEAERIVLEKQMKEVDKAEYMSPPLEELTEIELLFTPEGALAKERIDRIRTKLVTASMERKDNIPLCFKEKIENPNAGLFELMALFFAKEIKHNEIVRNIFEGQLLAHLDVELQGQRLTVERLEMSLLIVAKNVSSLISITQRTDEKVDAIAADVKQILEPKKEIKRPKIPDDIQALVDDSAQLANIGRYEEARSVAKKASELAVSCGDNIAIARTNCLLSIILCQKDRGYDEATNLLKDALAVFRDEKSEWDIADTLGRLGDAAIDGKQFDEGKAYLVQAQVIHKKLGDKVGSAQDYVRLGWIEYKHGRDKEALAFYDQALAYFLSAHDTHDLKDKHKVVQGIAGCYQEKGLVYQDSGRVADAEASYVRALDWMRKTGFQQDIAKILFILAKLKAKEAKYDSGTRYLDEAIQIYDGIKEYSWLSKCQQLKGQLFFTIRKPDKAIEAFEVALLSAEKSGDCEQEEHILSTLGNFHMQISEKVNKAREYFQKARDLSLREGLLDGYASSVENLARIADLEKKPEEKNRLLNEGVITLEKLLLQVQADPERTFITGQIGYFYEKMEEYQQALGYYLRSKRAYKAFSSVGGVAKCMASIAQIKRLTGKKDEELETYLELRKLLDGTPYHELISTTAIALSNIYMDKEWLAKAKSLLVEAEELCNKYNLGHQSHIQKSNKRLAWLSDIRKPQDKSFEQLVNELFELIDWFPEAKDAIFRFWFCGRRESLAAHIRNNTGVKLMICLDDVAEYKEISDSLCPYIDLSLMVVSSEYPTPGLDVMIPFPLDKKMFFHQGMGVGSYTVTSSLYQSKITGNTGAVVMGMSPGLPLQAHELFLSSSAADIISRKLFFLPYDRYTAQDKLQVDADTCLQFGLIPVYINALPVSKSADILLSKSIRLPVLSPGEVISLKKQIRNVKHCLFQLLIATHDNIQTCFNDFSYRVENLGDDYEGAEFVRLTVYVLDLIDPLNKTMFTAFVISR